MKKNEIRAYKAFNHDLTCRDYQFEIGKSYEVSGKIKICENGFHACENPLDTLSYYDLIDKYNRQTRFAEVVLSGEKDTEKSSKDSKIASARIKILTEIDFGAIVTAAVRWILAASGNDSQLAASGNDSKLAASGNASKLAAFGDDSQLAASGNDSQLAASGYGSQLAASGYTSQLAASGNDSQLAASGNDSQLAASGYDSKLAASGNASQLAASGNDSIITSCGVNSRVKGADGTWISLAEFDAKRKCIGFAVGCIGKDGLKADTWYRASKGKLVEVEDVEKS